MNRYIPLVIIAIIAIVIGVAVALAGRSQQVDQTTNPPPSRQNESRPTPPAASNNPATTDEVEIEDFAFRPANIIVKKGTTVTWTNKDDSAHTVTADGGSGPNSELFGRGQSYSYTFNETGEFSYFCKPHPYMKGKVTVTD